MTLQRRVMSLIAALCANHFRQANGIRDYCLFEPGEDTRCVLLGADKRCPYFEDAVLPIDPELQALYWADREARGNGNPLTAKDLRRIKAHNGPVATCANCGKPFVLRSNRQRYCPVCRPVIAREKQRQYRARRKRPPALPLGESLAQLEQGAGTRKS